MLTRLKVSGFKNLLDCEVRFGPFTCLVGPNGAGKSNLFDAIRFLSLLTHLPIMEAVKRLRETNARVPEVGSLFCSFGDFRAPEIAFAADMVVNRQNVDDFGVEKLASTSLLRYELRLRLDVSDGADRLELVHESLAPIKLSEGAHTLGFPHSPAFRKSCIQGRRGVPFISTKQKGDDHSITVHQEGHGGRELPASRSSRTVLSGLASADFPTALAANREMASWYTLMLEPSAMRAPSAYSDPRIVGSRGENLAGALHRLGKLAKSNGATFVEIANRLSELVDDVQELDVSDDPRSETLTVRVRGRDSVFHPARSLSDGTLRFLVLATIAVDPKAQGTICLEEPENGIHPARIPAILRLLKDIAVDPAEEVGADNPLRQVIVNTHSSELVKEVNPEDLVYVDSVLCTRGKSHGRIAAIRSIDKGWRQRLNAKNNPPVSRGQVRSYLEDDAESLELWKAQGLVG